MPVIDWSSVVPITAETVTIAVGSFMGLSVIAGILIFRIGMQLGPMLFRTIAQVMGDKPQAADLDPGLIAGPGYNQRGIYVGYVDYESDDYYREARGVTRDPDEIDEAIGRHRRIQRTNFERSHSDAFEEHTDEEMEELYNAIDFRDVDDPNDTAWNIGAEYHRRNLG